MQSSRMSFILVCAALLTVATAWAQDKPKADAPQAAAPAAQKEAPAADKTTGAKVGQPAPDFTLTDASGKKHTLADLKTQVVVLQWINKDCPYVQKAAPALKDVSKKYAGKVVWLAIDSTPGRTADDDAKYAKDQEFVFPILMDSDQKVGRAYGAKTTPHVFVIDKGKVVYTGALNDNADNSKKPDQVRGYVDEAITAVLAGKPVPLAETKPWGCGIKYKAEAKAKGEAEKGEAKDKG